MEFKDYYAALGVDRGASQAEVKRAYRKLARKYHPDVSKEPDAEARFKDVAEAHEALIDPERRAAYDSVVQRHAAGQAFEPPPGWDPGFEFSGRPGAGMSDGRDADFSAFFESLFGRAQGHPPGRQAAHDGASPRPGSDHHARIDISLPDAALGALRSVRLRLPVLDAQGRASFQERTLEVNIPAGVRDGQHLRLAGQGAAGQGSAPAGDLYLEVAVQPHPLFRLHGQDLSFDLPLAPWEAALGASVRVPTLKGQVELTVPAGSHAGRRLRLKGLGLPGKPPGDLYAVLAIQAPPAASPAQQAAYTALQQAFADHQPRAALEAFAP
jgi:curved DNA-binding protein